MQRLSCVRNWSCYTLFQHGCTFLHSDQQYMNDPILLHPCQHLIVAFFFSHSFSYVVVALGVIYISLIVNDTEYFLLCLFAICLSSLVKWLFISFFLFFNWIVLFCTAEFWELLKYNLDARSFMDMWFTIVISRPVTYYFILFRRSFTERKFWILVMPNLSICFFHKICLCWQA